MMKRKLRVSCSAMHGYLQRVWNFSDIMTLATMEHNEIDFFQIFKKTLASNKLMWKENETLDTIARLEYASTDMFKKLYKLMQEYGPGKETSGLFIRVGSGWSISEQKCMQALNERFADYYFIEDVVDDETATMHELDDTKLPFYKLQGIDIHSGKRTTSKEFMRQMAKDWIERAKEHGNGGVSD